jgi:hypothetical protein
MSEYQYYEFQAIDRALTEKEQDYIDSLSSRVDLSPHRAVFTYSYGDFRGDPLKVLQKYFDALLYLANWGSKQLVFRLPRSVITSEMIKPYCCEDLLTVKASKDHVIVEITCHEEEGYGWIEGEGLLNSLVPLRQDILRGDFRVLYLAWLKAISLQGEMGGIKDEDEYEDEIGLSGDELEPPVPANLKNLSSPLKRFIDFFEIDQDLIDVASEVSPQDATFSGVNFEELIAELTERERNDFLLKVARGEPSASIQLIARLQKIGAKKKGGKTVPTPHRRRAVDLLTAAQEKAKSRKEKERRKADKAKVRKLNELSKEQPKLWGEIFALIEKRLPEAYVKAVELLIQMRELAEYLQESDKFNRKIDEIYERYRNRPSLIAQLQHAGLYKQAS